MCWYNSSRAATALCPVLGGVQVVRQWAGLYDVTPDNNPILGPAGPENFFQLSGFVGHGFMMAPAVAELYADLVAGRGRDEIFDRFEPGAYSSREFIEAMGEYLARNHPRNESIVKTCYQKRIPIFCPAFSDCSAGFGFVLQQTDAIEEGRGVYDNITKSLSYLLAGNAGELAVMVGASLAGWPLPLLPVQLLWINFVTDGLPALALASDPMEPDILRRPPRDCVRLVMPRFDSLPTRLSSFPAFGLSGSVLPCHSRIAESATGTARALCRIRHAAWMRRKSCVFVSYWDI